MNGERKAPADMSGYDRNVRAAKLLQAFELTNGECALILFCFVLAVSVLVYSVSRFFS